MLRHVGQDCVARSHSRYECELPEAAYRAAITFLPVERTELVTATFLAVEAVLPGTDEDPPLNQYHLDALREAIAEEEAGLTLDGDVFMAELRAKHSHRTLKGSAGSLRL